MFESSFIQVTRKGKQVFIHNHCNWAIVGIATTNPKLPLPNIMFIARPGVGQISSGQHSEEAMLTRLIPLKFVRISIHDCEKQLIKIKLINRRSYYLQLYSSTEDVKALFDCWLSLIRLLHHPPRSYLQPYSKSRTRRKNLKVQVVPSEIDTKLDQGSLDTKPSSLHTLSLSIDNNTIQPDEVWEDEMGSLEKKATEAEKKETKAEKKATKAEKKATKAEKKATKAGLRSQDNIMGETYTKSEDYIIRMRSRLLTSSRRSLPSELESFESYRVSLSATAETPK
ncbi:UNVERIFIED_CONTAM: hypothetical protein K2H54_034318 [Gekko kuhli]